MQSQRLVSSRSVTLLIITLAVLGLCRAVEAGLEGPLSGFAVVVHPSNSCDEMALKQVRSLFLAGLKRWPNQKRVVLVRPPAQSPPSLYLLHTLLGMEERDYQRELAGDEFRGEEPVAVKVLNSDGAVCRFVFNVPGAAGLVAAPSLLSPDCMGVRALRIDGKAPGEMGYRLQ